MILFKLILLLYLLYMCYDSIWIYSIFILIVCVCVCVVSFLWFGHLVCLWTCHGFKLLLPCGESENLYIAGGWCGRNFGCSDSKYLDIADTIAVAEHYLKPCSLVVDVGNLEYGKLGEVVVLHVWIVWSEIWLGHFTCRVNLIGCGQFPVFV